MEQTLVVNRTPTSALVSQNFTSKTLPVSLLARVTEQAWRQSEDGEQVLSCCPSYWVRHICLSSCPTPKLLPTHHYLSLSYRPSVGVFLVLPEGFLSLELLPSSSEVLLSLNENFTVVSKGSSIWPVWLHSGVQAPVLLFRCVLAGARCRGCFLRTRRWMVLLWTIRGLLAF